MGAAAVAAGGSLRDRDASRTARPRNRRGDLTRAGGGRLLPARRASGTDPFHPPQAAVPSPTGMVKREVQRHQPRAPRSGPSAGAGGHPRGCAQRRRAPVSFGVRCAVPARARCRSVTGRVSTLLGRRVGASPPIAIGGLSVRARRPALPFARRCFGGKHVQRRLRTADDRARPTATAAFAPRDGPSPRGAFGLPIHARAARSFGVRGALGETVSAARARARVATQPQAP